LKSALVFLEFFISEFLKFSNSPTDLLKTGETTGFSYFRENRPISDRFFNPWAPLTCGAVRLVAHDIISVVVERRRRRVAPFE
jgi:hypothetical protein